MSETKRSRTKPIEEKIERPSIYITRLVCGRPMTSLVNPTCFLDSGAEDDDESNDTTWGKPLREILSPREKRVEK
jgi:hypothetical protein